MSDLRIGFSVSDSIVSKIVLWGSGAEVDISHSLFIAKTVFVPSTLHISALDYGHVDNAGIKGGFVDYLTVGAEGSGVDWVPKKQFSENNSLKAEFDILGDRQKLIEVIKTVSTKYGNAPYDHLAAGGVGIKHRLKWLWRKIGRWFRSKLSKNSVTCTELVIRPLQKVGYQGVQLLDPELTTAPELMKALYLAKDEFRLVRATRDVMDYLESL